MNATSGQLRAPFVFNRVNMFPNADNSAQLDNE